MSSTPHRSSLKVLPTRGTENLWAAYDGFIPSLQAAHRTPRTIEYYHHKLRPFVVWLEEQGLADIAQIAATHIRTFLLEREHAGRASLTVHHHAACIKAWLNFLVTEELLPSSPCAK